MFDAHNFATQNYLLPKAKGQCPVSSALVSIDNMSKDTARGVFLFFQLVPVELSRFCNAK
ncbi:MAG: hypothetical protein LBN07_00405 [Christensenellaceae bacterium]|nr:hypothetical protein [Christensenellaceae bacterium]